MKTTQDHAWTDRREIRSTLLAMACILGGLGGFAIFLADQIGTWTPVMATFGVTSRLMIAQDTWPLFLMTGVCLLAAFFLRPGAWKLGVISRPWTTLLIAALVVSVVIFGRLYVHHGYDLSADESMSWFQAQIFLEGELMARVPEQHQPFSRPYYPIFIFGHGGEYVASHYRPVYSALRALAILVDGDNLLGAILAAGSLLSIAAIARRVYPGQPWAGPVAALLLSCSPQFLVTSMTHFAFGAHLCLNLIWLNLFLRGGALGHLGAALVSMLALGLHQVHVHAFFAAPFLMALLTGGFGKRAYVFVHGLAYAIAVPVWLLWPEIARTITLQDLSMLPGSIGDIDYLRNFAQFRVTTEFVSTQSTSTLTLVNIARFLSWVSPALILLAALSLRRPKAMPLVIRLALAGFFVTVIMHIYLMPNQMHGWGWRYLHPVLGNLALVGVAGLVAFPSAARHAALLSVFSAMILVPWRLYHVDQKIAPRSAVQRHFETLETNIVGLRGGIYFGNDFIQNDPYLRNRPLIVDLRSLDDADASAFIEEKNGILIEPATLEQFGIGTGTLLEYRRPVP